MTLFLLALLTESLLHSVYGTRWNCSIDPCFAQHMGMSQNLGTLVNIKIAGKWMFIPLKMVLIGIDPYPYVYLFGCISTHVRFTLQQANSLLCKIAFCFEDLPMKKCDFP